LTKEEYQKKRQALIEKAEELLDKQDIEGYKAKEQEIKKLDNEFEEEAIKQANKRALENPKISDIGRQIITGGDNVKDKVILGKNDKFADWVKNKTGEPGQELDLGKIAKGMVLGDWKNGQAEFKNLNTTTGGALIPEMLSAQVIDLARAISLFGSAGVPVIPMETNNLTIGKVKTDPTLEFKEEGAEQSTANSMELEGIKLESKTIYGWATITLEAIESAKNLDEVVRNTFAKALAQGMDKAFLYGQSDGEGGHEDFAPSGILNSEDIEDVDASEGVTNYDDVIKAISKVKQNNADGKNLTWGYNAQTEEIYSLLKEGETSQKYIGPPKSVENLQYILSNQLEYDETDGSISLVFDPAALIIGMQNKINIKLLEGTDEGVKKGLVVLRIYGMVDAVLLQPGHVCKITGIGATGE